ncbi:MAG: AAA family ATPase [Candidatus Gottesmanbacteria bacterium]|nr:AAA family ATPase [Candidatus Gottesmanbacteria bacterium]
MKISHVRTKNFRCFGPNEQKIDLDKHTIFVGPNSSGKTATLIALLKVLGKSHDREITKEDFHIPTGVDIGQLPKLEFSIEVRLDFPELADDRDEDLSEIPLYFRQMTINKQGELPYCRIRLDASWQKGSTPEGIIESSLNFILSSEEEDPNGDNDENKKRVDSALLQEGIQYVYIPAIRNPESQLKIVAGTYLYRLFNSVKWSPDFKTKFEENIQSLNDVFVNEEGIKTISGVINAQWKNLYRGKKYTNTRINFTSKDLESLLKKVEIEFFPAETENSYDIAKLGDGIKSLFYLSLVNAIIDIESKIREKDTTLSEDIPPSFFTFIAMEEPENHLSPHLLGNTLENIASVSEKDVVQVVTTTHSPSTVTRVPPDQIRHFRLDNETQSTRVKRILLPDGVGEADKYVREAVMAFPEVYFAELVVLCEGDTERLVLPKVIEIYLGKADTIGVSIVPLGGRHVNHFWKLLYDLEIPFLTLTDIDNERNTGGWERIKYLIDQLIANGVDIQDFKKEDDSLLDKDYLESFTSKPHTKLEDMTYWFDLLEEYEIIFSRPLDMDFMLLEAYTDAYKNIVGSSVSLPDINVNPDGYNKQLKSSIDTVLKTENSRAETYSTEQKELMPLYRSLFLNRSKPSTHLQAMSAMNDEEIKAGLPEPLATVIEHIKAKLESK